MRLLLSVVILLSLYYVVVANKQYNLPNYFKALNVLLLMFTIYGVILILNDKQYYVGYGLVSKTNYLVIIFISLLPIYASYVFTRRGQLTEKRAQFYFVIFLIISIISFYSKQNVLLQQAIELNSSSEEFTNNVGYVFVGLLPAIVLFRKWPVLQYLFLGVCGYFILTSMKRGAILTGAVCLLWFMSINLKTATKRKKIIILIVNGLIVFLAIYFFYYLLNNSPYFQYRLEQTMESNSSGRDEIYSTLFSHFIQEDNPFLLLFGNGANGTLPITGNYAHNDWLELAINQGFLGLVVYLFYWICFIKSWRRCKNVPQSFVIVSICLFSYFLISIFSMSYNGMSRCASMALGYALAVVDKEQFSVRQKGDVVEIV